MIDNNGKVSVLFVCMGNICRSPTAEAVFRHIADDAGIAARLKIDSAGTHAYHTDEPADRRATAAAARRGYSMDDIRARRIQDLDFDRFDHIIAMDRGNQAILINQAEPQHHDKIRLFLEFSSGQEDEVPDPYYGGAGGFERVLDLIEDASRGLLDTIEKM